MIAPQIAKKLTDINAALEPLGPNLIEAHSRKGNGRYNAAGVVFWTSSRVPKLIIPTISRPRARQDASKKRREEAFLTERKPPFFQVTINGTRVREASTFEKTRMRNTSQ